MSTATNAAPAGLHELIRARWSPREFSGRPVEPEKLRDLFDAARWAASCFNEQPWRFVLVTQADPEGFSRVLGLLMEKNQQWAKTAWAIGFSAGKKSFTQSGEPNRFAVHDTGAATANLAIEAVSLGLRTHFMGGFDAQRAPRGIPCPGRFRDRGRVCDRLHRRNQDPPAAANTERSGGNRFWARLGFTGAIVMVRFGVGVACKGLLAPCRTYVSPENNEAV